MNALLARWLHAATLVVGGTGLVYGWMLYLAEPVDEFAVVNHPAQPALQALHVVLAPALLFLCGVIWRSHVWPRVRSGFGERRPTGLVLTALLAPMVLSGYLLQVTVDTRELWIWVHGVTSCLWILAYLVHVVHRTSGARRAARERAGVGASPQAPLEEPAQGVQAGGEARAGAGQGGQVLAPTLASGIVAAPEAGQVAP